MKDKIGVILSELKATSSYLTLVTSFG